jgi:hypothetical protein
MHDTDIGEVIGSMVVRIRVPEAARAEVHACDGWIDRWIDG